MKIVTIHLNNLEAFKLTFQSVKKFIDENHEVQWLIKDGLSENSQLETIKTSVNGLPRTQLVHNKDKGIYDAMNQAIDLIEDDDKVLFLNAGDQLSDVFIASFDKVKFLDIDLIYSDILFGKNKTLLTAPDEIDFAYLLGKTINHQSLIIKGKVLKKYHFKTDFSIVADWVQLFEIMKHERISIKKLNFPISIYEGGGISEKQGDLRKSQRMKYLETQYSQWELNSLKNLYRLRQRSWYTFVLNCLDSPKRSNILSFLSKLLK